MTRAQKRLAVPGDKLAEFCARNKIRWLALFGSVLREDFRAESDVDVLVEFQPGARVGLIRMGGMAVELESMLGRKVDLRTPADLSPYFRDQVTASAEVIHASG